MSKNIQHIESVVEEIYFESDAAIYKHIGRNQIDSETVALTEIVKNSYDADATEVRIYFDNPDKTNGEIIVTDNGTGMSPEEFKQFWMRPATSHKESEPRSKIFRRTMLGRKGMGRFGTDKIASVVVVKSKTRDDQMAFSARIDGDKFDQPGAKFEKTPVEFRPLHKDGLKFVLQDFSSGTEIRMKNLRTKWSKSMIREIREELSSMISPIKQATEFNITIEVKGDPELSGRLENKIATGYTHEMIVQVDRHDTYSITLDGKVLRTGNVIDDCEEILTNTAEDTISSDIAPIEPKSFGPLTSRVVYFKEGGLIKHNTAKHGKRVDHSGVKIYRSGFRVLPYGEKTDDWLRIKTKRASRGGKYYLHPEKIAGVIS
ncbi:MAG: ATP-binding protein, partial [Bacteroidota bacterium]